MAEGKRGARGTSCPSHRTPGRGISPRLGRAPSLWSYRMPITRDEKLALVAGHDALFASMAKDLNGTLLCESCQKEQPFTEREAAGYLMRGWPTCCGYTMVIAEKGGGR